MGEKATAQIGSTGRAVFNHSKTCQICNIGCHPFPCVQEQIHFPKCVLFGTSEDGHSLKPINPTCKIPSSQPFTKLLNTVSSTGGNTLT